MTTHPSTRRGASAQTRDSALVLRRFRYGESSLVVHLLTSAHGRVSLLAKGAYRPKSAYCGVLDLFDTLDLTWRARRGADLGLLAAGAIESRRRRVSSNLERYRAGLAMLELAGLGAREQHEERDLFALTEAGLDALHAAEVEPELCCAVFDLRFLRLQGVAPALRRCAMCGTDLPSGAGSVPFSIALGGRLCEACAREARSDDARGAEAVGSESFATLRLAQSLLDTPFDHVARIRLDSGRTRSLRAFVRRFLEYHLETRPRVWGPRSRADRTLPRRR